MTALPDSDAATSFVVTFKPSSRRLMASTTAVTVDDGAVDDAVGRDRLAAERSDFEALACRLELDRFDGARADVQTDEGFRSTKQRDVLS